MNTVQPATTGGIEVVATRSALGESNTCGELYGGPVVDMKELDVVAEEEDPRDNVTRSQFGQAQNFQSPHVRAYRLPHRSHKSHLHLFPLIPPT